MDELRKLARLAKSETGPLAGLCVAALLAELSLTSGLFVVGSCCGIAGSIVEHYDGGAVWDGEDH